MHSVETADTYAHCELQGKDPHVAVPGGNRTLFRIALLHSKRSSLELLGMSLLCFFSLPLCF